MNMLTVQNINQYYGGSHILRDVGFEARAGEVTVLLDVLDGEHGGL